MGDARELDLADACADAVLLLGPLYHLRRRSDRVRALAEARRVVRPGGPVFAAAISRWAPRLDGIMLERLDETYPDMPELVVDVGRTGQLPPLGPGSFSGFCPRPRQLHAELREAGLTVADLVSVEGPAFLLGDLAERLADPAARAIVLDTARAVERIPELLGIGPHLLGDRLAVVIFQLHQQPDGHLAAGLPGLPPGKAPGDLFQQIRQQRGPGIIRYRDSSDCRIVIVSHKPIMIAAAAPLPLQPHFVRGSPAWWRDMVLVASGPVGEPAAPPRGFRAER